MPNRHTKEKIAYSILKKMPHRDAPPLFYIDFW